jgi:signal transduction histidine kinase
MRRRGEVVPPLGSPAHIDESSVDLSMWARALALFVAATAIGLLFTSDAYALAGRRSWIAAARESMPRWYVWALLVPLVAWTDRRFAAGRPLGGRVMLHVPLGLWWTAVACVGQRLVYAALRPPTMGRWLDFVVMAFPWDLLVYGAIVGVVVARDYAADARQREREAAELAVRAARLEAGLAEARLSALGSQLHPHFLFNALNAVSAFTERDPAMARHLMAQLGGLLRASLDHAARPEVTLREELAFLDAYLDIERARFEDRLTVTVAIDEAAADARVPAFLLQPLVENAIKHGITQRATSGCVDVDVRVVADHDAGTLLRVRVRDDGVGLPPGWRIENHGGVGLRNVAARLEALYPSRHRFSVGPAAGGGVLVEIDLPFQRAAQESDVAGGVEMPRAAPVAATPEVARR